MHAYFQTLEVLSLYKESFIYGHLIKHLITDKVFMLEQICLQF